MDGPVSTQHFDATITVLRKEIEQGDAALYAEVKATDQRLSQQMIANQAAYTIERTHMENTVARIEQKVDMLLEWRTQAMSHTAQTQGRDGVLATILAAIIAVLVAVLGYVITRGI